MDPEIEGRLKRWRACIDSQDPNCIQNQILMIRERNAAWAVFYKSRHFAAKDAKGRYLVNGYFTNFIDRNFFENQLQAIRCLIDPSNFDGPKGVYSVMALLKDMILHKDILSRGNLFAVSGHEYDIQAIEKRSAEYMQQKYAEMKKQGRAIAFYPPENTISTWSRRYHALLDGYCGVAEHRRSQADTILLATLEQWKTELTVQCSRMAEYVNKYIAHSSSQESRAVAKDMEFTYHDIFDAQKCVISVTMKVAELFGITVVAEIHSKDSEFDHIEYPLIDSQHKEELWEHFTSVLITGRHPMKVAESAIGYVSESSPG